MTGDYQGALFEVVWAIVFFATWAYCVSTYGVLGLGLGWMPAGILATLAMLVVPLWRVLLPLLLFCLVLLSLR